MQNKIGFVGVGNMASAILTGILHNNYIPSDNIYIYDLDAGKTAVFESKGIKVCDSLQDLAQSSDVVVLAVKPQNIPDVLNDIGDLSSYDKTFVSIAAGISTGYIQSFVGESIAVVRVMPNTPLMLSMGACAICCTKNTNPDRFEFIKGIFSLGGAVEYIDETHMNEIIAVNGSSPAYIYLFAKAMADYAQDCGVDRSAALNLICATLKGSAQMIMSSGDDIETLIKKVSSPGGTTLAALDSLDKSGFYDCVKSAMKACTNRAEEIGR